MASFELLPPWGWWIGDHPAWIVTLVALCILPPIGLRLVRLVLDGVWHPWRYDPLAMHLAPLLAVALGVSVWLVGQLPRPKEAPLLWHLLVLAGCVLVVWVEREHVSGWRRRLSATSLYIFVMFPLVGYPLLTLFVVSWFVPWNTPLLVLMHAVPFVCIGVWMTAFAFYDPHHQFVNGRRRVEFTAPEGWKGPGLRWFDEKLRGYNLTYLPEYMRALRPWCWLLDMQPSRALVVIPIIMPGVAWANDILFSHGRFVPLNQQWVSPWLGDGVFLAVVMACGLWLLDKTPRKISIDRTWLRWLVHGGIVLAWLAFGVWHWVSEWGVVDTWAERTGPNTLYHTFFVYPFLGYAVTLVFYTALFRAKLRGLKHRAMYLLMVGSLVGYLATAHYDGKHQYTPDGRPKLEVSSPANPWCSGILSRVICGR